jgi:hypothetical protein
MQVSNCTLAFAIVMVMNQPRAKVKASRDIKQVETRAFAVKIYLNDFS